MPRSRKRHTHHRSANPHTPVASRRNKAPVFLSVLLGLFGLVIAYSASAENIIALILGTAAGAVLGYFIGKRLGSTNAR